MLVEVNPSCYQRKSFLLIERDTQKDQEKEQLEIKKSMRKRLRKKLYLGEYEPLLFEFNYHLKDEVDKETFQDNLLDYFVSLPGAGCASWKVDEDKLFSGFFEFRFSKKCSKEEAKEKIVKYLSKFME